MSRFAFCGATYTSQSVNADCQLSMGWYPESDESGQGKSAVVMYPTPGLKEYCELSGPSVRGFWTINGRCFVVSGTSLYEIFNTPNTTLGLGTIASDGLPVSMTSSPQQLLIASAGNAYVLNLATNVLTPIPNSTFSGPVSQVDFCDGFFLALIVNSQQFYASVPLDATTWPGAQTGIVSVFSDNVLAMKVNQRQVWLLGRKSGVVYYDSGNIFPFDVVPGGFIENGIIAMNTLTKLDNSLFWLDGDERGNLVARRASGYTPVRVSNHAVEQAWQQFSTGTDAIAYAYQDRGHAFWVIYFPTANQTWVYDVATGSWHNRGFLDGNGIINAHHSQCHAFIFGQHLVGDWSSGLVYSMSINYYDDNGSPIKRIRRAPHISTENQWMLHQSLQLDLESGLGPQPPLLDGAGNARDPQVMLRWSDDGGHTWSNQQTAGAGQSGQYRKRVIWRRLGRSRDRVYEISTSDKIPWRLVDAYLKADAGYKPQERLTNQLRKEA